MQENQNHDNNSDMSDISDDDMNIEDYLINNNKLKKLYQVQYINNKYKFVNMGLHEKEPIVEIYNFEFENTKHYINSRFIFEEDIKDNNLFDMIAIDSIVNGEIYSLVLSACPKDEDVDCYDNIKEGNIEFEGLLCIYIHEHKTNKKSMLKRNLTYPSNEKLIYYLIAELKNDKVKEIYYKK